MRTGGVGAADAAVWRWTPSVRTPALTAAAHVVTTLGSFPVVVAVAVLTAALLWRRTRSPASSTVLLTAVGATAATVYLTKVAVGRARPSTSALLGMPSLDYSFPSGHTTNSAVVYLLGALLLATTLDTAVRRQLLTAVAMAVAVAVGLTRLYLGYHWATDVLAGWFLAAAVVSAGAYLAQLLAGTTAPAPPPLDPDAIPGLVDVAAPTAPQQKRPPS